MKAQRSTTRHWLVRLVLLLLVSGCTTGIVTRAPIEITEPIPRNALNFAIHQIDKPYVWGGQGPDAFDCSGIIICAHENALQSPIYLMNKRDEICDDVTMDELYKYNIRMISKDEVQPGDIVFITNKDDRITHGGLFIRWKEDNSLEFINASSYFGKTLIDDWPLGGTKRGQWVAGFGRLKIIQSSGK